MRSSETRQWLFKMKIAKFAGQVRINISDFVHDPEKYLAWKKMKRGGERISI